MYIAIYIDKNDEIRKWKKAQNRKDAEDYGIEHSDNDYEVCVPLWQYERLESKIKSLESKLTQIKTICE